jgi:hypothetical protein
MVHQHHPAGRLFLKFKQPDPEWELPELLDEFVQTAELSRRVGELLAGDSPKDDN